ncbi:MAG TPA: YdeI/OmpD-associated family protein [Longimicrobiaceae bacterium]|nr:YdeI/OmpD-associated family protein [Longimicrobiaceae bacterium]
MGTRDPRIDQYIDRSADFAKPILTHIREVVHAACPEVEETMKWSMPHFMYKGMLAGMSSFKQHCAFGFWKGSLIGNDDQKRDAMGQFGRITSVADLPPDDVLAGYVREAMRLNDEGVKPRRRAKPAGEKKPVETPADLAGALASNPQAQATWDGFSPGKRKEYVEWVTEAKTDATRQKRLATTVEWVAEGKARNWKYEKC